ncbi:hypothetical protein Avbf_17116 [Armadillidium vulgare]|nr:hypothetical protein Avbf_17116 [Armadillidium vulgare]
MISCLNKLNEDSESDKETYKPASATSQLLSGFFLILRYLFKGDMKHVNDYKVALVRAQTFSSRKVSKILGVANTLDFEFTEIIK